MYLNKNKLSKCKTNFICFQNSLTCLQSMLLKDIKVLNRCQITIRGNQVRVFGPQTITNKGSQLTHNKFRMTPQSSFQFTSCAGTRCTRQLWWCCRVVRFGTGAESKQPLTWCDCQQRLSGHMDRNWWCEQVLRNQFGSASFPTRI